MNLDETQRGKVTGWIKEGLKLSEIQNRLLSEFSQKLTYMEVRLLVDDLKLTPKDAEPSKPVQSPLSGASVANPTAPGESPLKPNAPAGAKVAVSVDQITRPGALVSGKVTFSDGQMADWYLDQTGRLGLAPQQQGYRPQAGDVQQFQAALEMELARLGM